MDKKTKLTLAELVKRKEQIQTARKTKATKDLYIESLGSVITVEEPAGDLVRDALDMESGADADRYMCYECIKEPNLKAAEAQEAFGCGEPTDIVDAIFKPGEIPQIARICIGLAGYNGSVEEIKN